MNKYYQVFAKDLRSVEGYGMSRKSEAGNALDTFFQDLGIPNRLHTDGAKELTLGKWKDIREKVGGVSNMTTEPGSPWQNLPRVRSKSSRNRLIVSYQRQKHLNNRGTLL
jgi:hypothetical protein